MATLLPALVLGACASVDPRPPMSPGETGISSELQYFLRDLEEAGLGFDPAGVSETFLLLDVQENSWIMDILRSRDLLDTRLAARTEYLMFASRAGEPPQIWVAGRFPRFWTGIVLSANGWRRSAFGRWQDAAGTEVQLAWSGFLRITPSETVLRGLTRDADGDSYGGLPIVEVLRRASDDSDGLLYARSPRFSRLPVNELGRLNPEWIILSLRDRQILDTRLAMQGDREARVTVVTLRLASRGILSALEVSAGDQFAVDRDGVVVHVRDIVLEERAIQRLLDRLVEEGETR